MSFDNLTAHCLQEPVSRDDEPAPNMRGDVPAEPPRTLPLVEPPQVDFDDARSAFGGHSTAAMLRSLAVFSLCSVQVRRFDQDL